MSEKNTAEIERFLENSAKASLLRFSTAGSVDDGKSTLIGRLLHDSKNIYEDQLASLQQRSVKRGREDLELALLTDGLKAEQEQGITIDVAYRYFSTPNRRFILADSPGHEQYTRNMATGASTADLTILLVDASRGVLPQTRRHAFIAALMGVPRLLVAINKMDAVDYSEDVYEAIKKDFLEFSEKLGIKFVRFIPVSALAGDNVVNKSEKLSWFEGETLIESLENMYNQADFNLVDFRFPVQYVINPSSSFRGYAGQIASGTIRVGEEVMILPSMKKNRVKSISYQAAGSATSSLDLARTPQSVVLTLEDQVDISRGSMLVRPGNVPKVEKFFEAMVVWMGDTPLDINKQYYLRHTTNEVRAHIDGIHYKIDINNLSRLPGTPLELNEIGRLSISTTNPLFLDTYKTNRSTGNFILIDPVTYLTVAAGMILDHFSHDLALLSDKLEKPRSTNLHQEHGLISKLDREQHYGHRALTYWFTGLSGSGKSTVAKAFEKSCFDKGRPIYCLDGDNIRTGLNRDLDFTREGRRENLRRIAEVARLFNDAGITVVCSFISPTEADRLQAKSIIGEESFIEVFLSTPLEVCEARDPHNLYKKARNGEIPNFTGVNSPFEKPTKPDVTIDTSRLSIEECVKLLEEV